MADKRHLYQDVSKRLITPDLLCFSDVLYEGWPSLCFRPWPQGADASINLMELNAIRMGLMKCVQLLRGKVVGLFCYHTTAVAYLRKEGGTRSLVLNWEAQAIRR